MSSWRSWVPRFDGWFNSQIGFGTEGTDRTIATIYGASQALSDATLSAMYTNEHLSAKIVDVVPREAMREGFELGGLDVKTETTVLDYLAPYQLSAKIAEAWIWGRLYGGSALWVITEEDDLLMPLVSYDRVEKIVAIDRRHLQPSSIHKDRFGIPTAYDITSPEGDNRRIGTVHASRLILFPGARTESRAKRMLGGWDYSVLQRPYDAIRSEGTVWKSTEALVSESSVGILKIKNWFSIVSSEIREATLTRLHAMLAGKSILKSLVIDQENEDYTRINAQFAGLPDLTDRAMKRVAAAAEIPVTVLMGEAPAGLNATGDSDLRWFFARVVSERKLIAEPHVLQLLKILLGAKSSPVSAQVLTGEMQLQIKWPELWAPSQTERATIYGTVATADNLYIDKGVLTVEEIRRSRFGEDGYSLETQIDQGLEGEMGDIEEDDPELDAFEEDTEEPSNNPDDAKSANFTLSPTDMAKIITVNEARAKLGLGTVEHGDLTIEAFNALQTAAGDTAGKDDPTAASDELPEKTPEPSPIIAGGAGGAGKAFGGGSPKGFPPKGRTDEFDDSQPRDEGGRWTAGGGSGRTKAARSLQVAKSVGPRQRAKTKILEGSKAEKKAQIEGRRAALTGEEEGDYGGKFSTTGQNNAAKTYREGVQQGERERERSSKIEERNRVSQERKELVSKIQSGKMSEKDLGRIEPDQVELLSMTGRLTSEQVEAYRSARATHEKREGRRTTAQERYKEALSLRESRRAELAKAKEGGDKAEIRKKEKAVARVKRVIRAQQKRIRRDEDDET